MAFGSAYISAQKFVKLLADSGTKVDSAYIFGSYAKGINTEISDIDVCVISPEFGKDSITERAYLESISRKVDENIEPLAMSPEEFAEKYNPLASEIKATGIKIE